MCRLLLTRSFVPELPSNVSCQRAGCKHLAKSKLKVTDVLRAKICNELHRKAVTLA